MKYIILIAALSFVGCASAKKTTSNSSSTNTATTMAQKAAKQEKTSNALVCTKKKDTRKLEVVTKGKGCELNYTKFGKMKAVASSSHGTKHCVSSQAKIQSKLEKSGFQCK